MLLQCFERRCLTYTPGNEIGFRVEAGNVGRHYYQWRYGADAKTEQVDLHLVALGDEGQNGKPIGCGDSLVPLPVQIAAAPDAATRVERTLNELFGISEGVPDQEGLYNALQGSTFEVQSVTVNGGEAIVEIGGDVSIGGACDEPRFVEQIRETVLQVDGVDTASIRRRSPSTARR